MTESIVMQFNIADLFECVADAAPDRDAVVCGATPVDVRRARRPVDPSRARSAPTSAPAPARTSACYLGNSIAHLEAMLALLQGARASRSTSTTATSTTSSLPVRRRRPRRLALRRDDRATAPRAASRSASLSTRTDPTTTRSSRPRRRRATSGPAPRDDHYVLYTGGTTGHAEGCGVAPGRHLLRARSAAGIPADRRSRRPRRSRPRWSTIPRNACARSSRRAIRARNSSSRSRSGRSCTRAVSGRRSARLLGGGKVVLYDERARRHDTRARPHRARTRQRDEPRRRRERAAAARRRSPRIPGDGTRRRCCCSDRAAASSPATRRTR